MPINCFSDVYSKSTAKCALALASILMLFLIAGSASSNQTSGNKASVPLTNAVAVASQTSDSESHAPSGGRPPDSDEAAEVEKLDRELSAAGVRGDLDATERLIADQAIFVDDLHASGKKTTKADILDFMKLVDYKLESETFDDLHAMQFGDTVVLWARVTARGSYKNKPFRDNSHFTDVWQKHDGKWQQVFTRATPAGKPE